MSLFPRSMFTSDFPRFPTSAAGEFAPLFRLLDDYASHRTGDPATSGGLASFTPKFDVKETKEAYELHGELPGIEQKDVQIEFSDANTLTVKGRVEHRSDSGTPPSHLLGSGTQSARLTEGGAADSKEHYQAPSVEDAEQTTTNNGGTTEVAKTGGSKDVQKQQDNNNKTSHYWISERSVGEFQRSFAFPTRVDHDAVKASLKNGILSIIVPKSAAPTTRKIQIE